jgi:hypothetical protein
MAGQDREYTFFWLDGRHETLRGHDAADALSRAGYGGGAVGALDFYAEGRCGDYEWDSQARTWTHAKAG